MRRSSAKCWRMFSAQASRLVEALGAMPADAAALAHTLKGSARAVGAFAVGDAAAHLENTDQERAAIRRKP